MKIGFNFKSYRRTRRQHIRYRFIQLDSETMFASLTRSVDRIDYIFIKFDAKQWGHQLIGSVSARSRPQLIQAITAKATPSSDTPWITHYLARQQTNELAVQNGNGLCVIVGKNCFYLQIQFETDLLRFKMTTFSLFVKVSPSTPSHCLDDPRMQDRSDELTLLYQLSLISSIMVTIRLVT